jgi:hypothetical protein
MGKTIRVSDDFHAWVKAHRNGDETMEVALRRLTRGPHPNEVAGLLTPDEAEELKEVVKTPREGDGDRKRRAREAFASDE